jgi:sterol desaturase/sphingolipid hydroxylase (fatty acid hydroxylase superfamily)
VIIFVVASDFLLYWIHRGFHRPAMWKYHAIHHSSEELEWISAARFHPVNIFLGTVAVDVALLLAGISPEVMVVVGPFTIAYSAFVHANLNWTFGPFKYVLASPVFHRWHHTAFDKGGDKNFAGTFPVFDWLFGTFYMPEHELPETYGVDDKEFPDGFGAQLLYPFKQ